MSAPASFTAVCRFSELESGEGRARCLDGRSVALFRIGAEVFALDDTCSHRGGALSAGDLSGQSVYCPLHAWAFDLRTGLSLNQPGASVGRYPVELRDDDVLLGPRVAPALLP